jgi:hypothetical protein
MAKQRDLTALMRQTSPQVKSGASAGGTSVAYAEKRRTLIFSGTDEMELDRIEAHLRERGYSRIAVAKLIRIALRVAFKDGLSDSDVRDIYEEVMAADGRSRGEGMV